MLLNSKTNTLAQKMTARQTYSAFGPLPARPPEAQLLHRDGNITAHPAKEQAIPAGACERGVTAASRKVEPVGIKEDEFWMNLQFGVTTEFLFIGESF